MDNEFHSMRMLFVLISCSSQPPAPLSPIASRYGMLFEEVCTRLGDRNTFLDASACRLVCSCTWLRHGRNILRSRWWSTWQGGNSWWIGRTESLFAQYNERGIPLRAMRESIVNRKHWTIAVSQTARFYFSTVIDVGQSITTNTISSSLSPRRTTFSFGNKTRAWAGKCATLATNALYRLIIVQLTRTVVLMQRTDKLETRTRSVRVNDTDRL